MTPQETKSYLDSFINYELNLQAVSSSQFKLDRIEQLLEELGNPHKDLKCIHVAGTKGKGSTCAFAASILQQAGYKVGLYTSPHLKNFRERIRILNLSAPRPDSGDLFRDCITNEELENILQDMKPALEKFRNTELGTVTYYEVLTAAAFCYFHRENVDCMVLETGLGGRLDATNVVDSLVCGITPVSLEHTQILGNTIEAIAAEKAAIIKGNRPVVIVAPQERSAAAVIEARCQSQKAPCLPVGQDISYEFMRQDLQGLIFDVRSLRRVYRGLRSPLLGKHQMMNAAVAIGMVEVLDLFGFEVSEEQIHQGVARVQWPGRFEIVQQKPVVILDCAHNPSSTRQLISTLEELFPGKQVRLVFGISNDKDRADICRLLDLVSKDVILTRANHPRASEFSKLDAGSLFPDKAVVITNNIHQAMDAALEDCRDDDVVVVTGSVFVVGEAREYLSGTRYV